MMSRYEAGLIRWDIYEIHSTQTALHGVMLRGRIRKLGLEKGITILCENASDAENCVRFAVIASSDATIVADYLKNIISDAGIKLVARDIANPVLSKLKINKAERYVL